MAFKILSHTADTGIEVTAPSFPELMAELARGMFAIMGAPSQGTSAAVVVEVEAESVEDLVVDALSELLYESETEDLLFCEFRVEGSPQAVRMEAAGVPVRSVEETGPPIKAITYHELVVEPRPDGWYARVYFDV